MISSSLSLEAPSVRRELAPAGLVGGVGGLVFVLSVVAQNALRAGYPGNGAGAATVADYYAAHRGVTLVLAVLYPLGALGLVAFLGATLARITQAAHRAPAIAGGLGAAGIVSTYTMLMATDLGLSGYIDRGSPDPGVVAGLWTTHNAVFGVLLACIALALIGLTAASSAAGQLPQWWMRLGLCGGVLLLVASATTPAIIDGAPTLFVGVAGFLVWLGFVVRNSVSLLRDRRPTDQEDSHR